MAAQFSKTRASYLQMKSKFLWIKKELNNAGKIGGMNEVDFEKIKIENQSLNEKIEQRNDEIFKIR